MPRHPPIALISLDRSHCQYSSKLPCSFEHSSSNALVAHPYGPSNDDSRTVLQNPKAPSKPINDNELWKDKE